MPLANARKGDFTLEELIHPQTSLAKHYHKKLPMRGWAGRFNKTEKEYVKLVKEARQKSHLRASGHIDKQVLG